MGADSPAVGDDGTYAWANREGGAAVVRAYDQSPSTTAMIAIDATW